jgi:hypothetical protein
MVRADVSHQCFEAPRGLCGGCAALTHQIAALVADVAVLKAAEAARVQRQQVAGLRRGDAAALVKILPAIAGAWGSEPFLSEHLADTAGLRIVLAGRSPKKIGRLLARAEGVPLAGYVVEADGKDGNRRRWRVRGVLCG